MLGMNHGSDATQHLPVSDEEKGFQESACAQEKVVFRLKLMELRRQEVRYAVGVCLGECNAGLGEAVYVSLCLDRFNHGQAF